MEKEKKEKNAMAADAADAGDAGDAVDAKDAKDAKDEEKILTGKLYYNTGELYFQGFYCEVRARGQRPRRKFVEGIEYYRNGNKHREGVFQGSYLLAGREYYESGALKFEGVYFDKLSRFGLWNRHIGMEGRGGGYYGPPYPVAGRFYSEDGKLLYEGRFKITQTGSMFYPTVVVPEGFGPLK